MSGFGPTSFIDGKITHGTVFPYQTGWCYTVCDASGNAYHIRNVTHYSATGAKQVMRDVVESHNKACDREALNNVDWAAWEREKGLS